MNFTNKLYTVSQKVHPFILTINQSIIGLLTVDKLKPLSIVHNIKQKMVSKS